MWIRSLGQKDPLEKGMAPLQYSCLENPMHRGAWRVIVHRVAKNWTQLSDLACMYVSYISIQPEEKKGYYKNCTTKLDKLEAMGKYLKKLTLLKLFAYL